MFNFVRIKGLTSKGIVGNQPTTKLAPLKLTSDKLKRQASRRDNMKVKKLIEILKQAPQNIDVDIFDYSTEYLLSIDDVWIPKKEDMEDNPEVQITINKQASEQKG